MSNDVMFYQRATSIIGELVPGLVAFGLCGIGLIVIVRLGLLPSSVLIAYFGPGFLVASFVFPTGIHSTWNGMYVVLGLAISFVFWFFAARGVGKLFRARLGQK